MNVLLLPLIIVSVTIVSAVIELDAIMTDVIILTAIAPSLPF